MKITPIIQQVPHAPAPQVNNSLQRAKDAFNQAPQEEELPTPDPLQTNTDSEVTKPLSPQFAALAKEKRALQLERKKLEQDREAMQASQAGFIDPKQLKASPLKTLLDSGITYEELIRDVNASSSNSELDQIRAELKAQKEDFNKTLSERDAQVEEQVLNEMISNAERIIQERPDDFELVRETKSLPLVKELIKRDYKATGYVWDEVEALQAIEDELFDRNLVIAKYKKIQSAIAPPQLQQQQPQGKQMKTLTARDTSKAPMDSKARAIAAFHGTLRK